MGFAKPGRIKVVFSRDYIYHNASLSYQSPWDALEMH